MGQLRDGEFGRREATTAGGPAQTVRRMVSLPRAASQTSSLSSEIWRISLRRPWLTSPAWIMTSVS